MSGDQFAAVAQALLDVLAPAIQTWFVLFVGLSILAAVVIFILMLIRPRITSI